MTVDTILQTRPPISIQAKGQLRILWAEVEAEAAEMTAAIKRVPLKVRTPSTWKGRTGARRALERICAAMPKPPDRREPGLIVWRFLRPVPTIPIAVGADPDPPQPALVVMAIVAARRSSVCRVQPFGLA
jgi:hypothetical protein